MQRSSSRGASICRRAFALLALLVLVSGCGGNGKDSTRVAPPSQPPYYAAPGQQWSYGPPQPPQQYAPPQQLPPGWTYEPPYPPAPAYQSPDTGNPWAMPVPPSQDSWSSGGERGWGQYPAAPPGQGPSYGVGGGRYRPMEPQQRQDQGYYYAEPPRESNDGYRGQQYREPTPRAPQNAYGGYPPYNYEPQPGAGYGGFYGSAPYGGYSPAYPGLGYPWGGSGWGLGGYAGGLPASGWPFVW